MLPHNHRLPAIIQLLLLRTQWAVSGPDSYRLIFENFIEFSNALPPVGMLPNPASYPQPVPPSAPTTKPYDQKLISFD